MISWDVAYTQPSKELIAKQHLLEQGFEVYLPQFKKTCRHARKVEEKLTPLFPRYIFVRIDSNSAHWRSVNGTHGIAYLFLINNLNPIKVPTYFIDNLPFQEISEGSVPSESPVTSTKGEKERIMDGVFKDYLATFNALEDKSRVQLLLIFMGREMKMTLSKYAMEVA